MKKGKQLKMKNVDRTAFIPDEEISHISIDRPRYVSKDIVFCWLTFSMARCRALQKM